MNRLIPTLVVPPATALYDLGQVKRHIKREDIDDDDEYINDLISLAIARLDGPKGMLGRGLINQTWSETADDFPAAERLELNLAPAVSVVKVEYYDLDNALQTFAAANYTLHNRPEMSYLRLTEDAAWPSTFDRDDAINVEYVAGYGAAPSDVPWQIIHAGLFLIGHWERFRQPVISGTIATPVPDTFLALIRDFKRPVFHDNFKLT